MRQCSFRQVHPAQTQIKLHPCNMVSPRWSLEGKIDLGIINNSLVTNLMCWLIFLWHPCLMSYGQFRLLWTIYCKTKHVSFNLISNFAL